VPGGVRDRHRQNADRCRAHDRATVECADGERGHWAGHFERNGFAVWLSALRDHLQP
jgi:hypothetical protein